jgi:nucleotide-binding universal stress UspA family protein
VGDDKVAEDLADRFGESSDRRMARAGERLLDAVVPDELEGGPAPGTWRRREVERRQDERLFPNTLVALRGDEAGWAALDFGLQIAQREQGRLRGLHVVQQELTQDELRPAFERRCADAGVDCAYSESPGPVTQAVSHGARWADLVVLHLAHPPSPQPLVRLGSGFRQIVRRCGRPVLAVPSGVGFPEKALLAYDGSLRAKEALFVAAYLAGRWGLDLCVLSVEEKGKVDESTLANARAYLEMYRLKAQYMLQAGSAAQAILDQVQEEGRDLIIMGGYGDAPLVEAVLGSALDRVLREAGRAVLICS